VDECKPLVDGEMMVAEAGSCGATSTLLIYERA
jgi:hypothetical protein